MTKKRTMNELRQTKDVHYVNPTFKIGDQGGDFIKPTDKPAKSTGEVMKGQKFTTWSNPFENEEVDKTVDQIVEDLQPQILILYFK